MRKVPSLLAFLALAACQKSSPTVTHETKEQASAKPVATATATSSAAPSHHGRRHPGAVDREVGRRFGFDNDDTPTNKRPGSSASGRDVPNRFGLYVLALSWAPSFCCGHQSKGQCDNLETSFGADHLTLHGLWPNYTDEESSRIGVDYPTFCGKYKPCKGHDAPAFCSPDPADIPPEMTKYGPGYVADDHFLAKHEWPKHGSCTGLDDKTFFRDSIRAMLALPGESGTPDAIRKNLGGSVKTADLQAAFKAKDGVLLSCDSRCNLRQIGICLGHDEQGHPTAPIACPKNVTQSNYDNSCITQKCDEIHIQKAGQCSRGGKGGGDHDHGSGGKCSSPGQGPACTNHEECTAQGFLRCARSGCCTSIPF